MAEEKFVYMTKAGKTKKQEELNYLENEKRNEIDKEIQYAKSLGDFSENAELDAAKEKREKNEAAIMKLRSELENVKIIKADTYKVYDYDDEEEVEYTLVGSSETDVLNNQISDESPLGKAIKGKKAGEEVLVKASADYSYKVKILEVIKDRD